MTRSPFRLAPLAVALLSACSFAPRYSRPPLAIPPSFKEAPGWQAAAPSDAIAKGEWWRLFGDPVLDGLEARVAVSNQNVAAAVATYAQARAAVREVRAELFPTVDLSGSATRAGTFGPGRTTIIGGTGSTSTTTTTGGGGTGGTTTGTTGSTGTGGTGTGSSSGTVVSNGSGNRRYSLSIGGTWEPDLWGRIASNVRQEQALAVASQSDLANATLSAQGEVALDYLQLRGLDRQKEILDATVAAYNRALTITTNRYNQGVIARVDVLQAQTQLTTARANAADLVRQRQLLEHAIAVLVGEAPGSFTLATQAWRPVVPQVPGLLPAAILERRPDVAGAERRVAAANQAIGVQRAAFFPSFTLTGDLGSDASSIGSLFDAASSIWSLGLRGALTLLDFGARAAQVAQARAAYEAQVATYRQTVLTALQQVEDELVAGKVLAYVGDQRAASAQSANRVEQLTQNQYLAGQIAYTDVITAQATALSARQSEAQTVVDRQVAAVSLIQAIGGSWPTPGTAVTFPGGSAPTP